MEMNKEKEYYCYHCKGWVLRNAFGFWCQECQRYYKKAWLKNKLIKHWWGNEYIETITKPVVIKFKGKDGKLIKFNATKCIKKPLKVNFHKIKKEYKSK